MKKIHTLYHGQQSGDNRNTAARLIIQSSYSRCSAARTPIPMHPYAHGHMIRLVGMQSAANRVELGIQLKLVYAELKILWGN